MINPTSLTVVLVLTFSTAVISADSALPAPSTPPNIVFLFTDDQTVRAAGCYGNKEVRTPHLDRLAADGVRFANHYNTTAICMASRCNVLTGLYEYRHGCNFSHGDLERRFMDKSYPVLLRSAGYYTGFAGKIGFSLQGETFEAFARLFDDWAGGPGQTFYETARNQHIAKYADKHPHCSRAYGAWAVDFMKSAKASGKPFCMSISFKAPHLPFTPDPQDLKLYEGRKFTRPQNYGVANAAHLSPQAKTSRAWTDYREWVTDYDGSVAKYYALISGVDAAVGMIREGLAQQGLADSTVIIFTSDNGYSSGSHGFGDKVLPYEEASKSPLVIYDPRQPKSARGAVSEAVTGNVDMAATIFDLAGVGAPDDIDGKSLLPLLRDPKGSVRDALPLFNFWGKPSAQSMAVVTPRWKYIYWYYGERMTPTEELFHLGQDPYEMSVVTNDERYAKELAAMRRHYDAEVARMAAKVVKGHGYEAYPTLFDRSIGWDQKSKLLKTPDKMDAQKPGKAKAGGNQKKPK